MIKPIYYNINYYYIYYLIFLKSFTLAIDSAIEGFSATIRTVYLLSESLPGA